MEFKINRKDSLRSLTFGLVITLMFLILMVPLRLGENAFWGVFVFWSILVLPGFIIHMEYWFEDRLKSFSVEYNKITIKHKGVVFEYQSDEIERIDIYKSRNLDWKGYQLMSWESYFFIRIYPVNDPPIIITSLLSNELDKLMKQRFHTNYFRPRCFFTSLSFKPTSA